MMNSVSVVINTCDRFENLSVVLAALKFQKYRNFEVVVVNGPSTDETEKLLEQNKSHIRIANCAVKNLSVSRNIGIQNSRGDIIAFLDDDAIPEPEWLEEIVKCYQESDVGAVGGFVYDHTGYNYQSKYIICDRFGNAKIVNDDKISDSYSFPFTHQYPSLIGANSSFRREILERIGGFDEHYAYYLDETDVCIRVNDLGYRIVTSDKAKVLHKFAKSHLRDPHRVVRNYYPSATSRGYFAVKHGQHFFSLSEILNDIEAWYLKLTKDIFWQVENSFLTVEEYETCLQHLKKGIKDGFNKALEQKKPVYLQSNNQVLTKEEILPYVNRRNSKPLSICLLSQDYPPRPYGGIGKWTVELAEGLAENGHDVHVVTRGGEQCTVDFENNVWVHRVAIKSWPQKYFPKELHLEKIDLPSGVFDYALSVHEEVKRIHKEKHLDVVSAPIWDHEGIACMHDPELCCMITLMTTYNHMLDSNPNSEWLSNKSFMKDHVLKMIAAERYVLGNAEYLQTTTNALVEGLEKVHQINSLNSRTVTIPLGIKDLTKDPSFRSLKPHLSNKPNLETLSQAKSNLVNVLYVGRFEERKGIDILFKTLPEILTKYPNVRVTLIGDSSLKNKDKKTFKEIFIEDLKDQSLLQRINFCGYVTDEERSKYYQECDLFVAPSRYESFGLIFLEAMMFGKPVIGCKAGGMPEVIGDGGLLAIPGDAPTLMACLEKLIESKELREELGRNGQKRFQERFTIETMVSKMEAYFYKISNKMDLQKLQNG